MIRVTLPHHLRTLARTGAEVEVVAQSPVTIDSVLTALESEYPMLKGTIRDHVTHKRRPFIRFFACCEDVSMESPDFVLPPSIADGRDPFMVVGAIAGG